MSTATLERVALPEGFEEREFMEHERQRLGWDRRYQYVLKRGATEWRVGFMFGTSPKRERIVVDGEPFHRPVVHIFKRAGHRESQVWFDEAPLYVQKFVNQHIWRVAEYEQQRHGVPPMTMAQWRAAEDAEYLRQRELIELVARSVREVAPCGTPNSEAIAEWILKNFVERIVHDDVIAEHRETLKEIAAERKGEHAEIIDELNSAIDIAKRADKAIEGIGRAVAQLEAPGALEFAYGSTEAEKVLDLMSDGINAVDEYMQNPSNSDLPEKRKA